MIVGIDKCLVVGGRSTATVHVDVMCAGRLFQTRGLATGKARVPIVDSLNGGTRRTTTNDWNVAVGTELRI